MSNKPTYDRTIWTNKPLAERLAWLSNLFVEHDAAARILRFIERELVFAKARNKGIGALVIAPSGAGKTTLIRELHRRHPTVISETATVRPIVHFEIPDAPTPNSMGAALLKALGDPVYNAGTARAKADRIKELLPRLGVQVIAVDDFQDVPARRGSVGVRSIGDWIRKLCEMPFGGLVVAFGTEDAAIVRDSNPQLLRRMQARLELPLFSVDTSEDGKRFRVLVKSIECMLPLAESSDLTSTKSLVGLLAATHGNLDYLIKLLERSVAHAVSSGREHLTMEDLRLGFEDQHQIAALHGNPFSPDYDGLRLDRAGQIFHRNLGPDAATNSAKAKSQSSEGRS